MLQNALIGFNCFNMLPHASTCFNMNMVGNTWENRSSGAGDVRVRRTLQGEDHPQLALPLLYLHRSLSEDHQVGGVKLALVPRQQAGSDRARLPMENFVTLLGLNSSPGIEALPDEYL